MKNRLDRLQYRNFTADGMAKANKLKCKAAVARDLVPFLPTLRQRFFATRDPRDQTIRCVAQSLAECYSHSGQPGPQLASASRKFANAYAALEAHERASNPASAHWRIKPKLHLFQELCEFGTRAPRPFWCYQDETFGNLCADLALRRGGKDNPGHNAEMVLNAWCCRQSLPTPFRPQRCARKT